MLHVPGWGPWYGHRTHTHTTSIRATSRGGGGGGVGGGGGGGSSTRNTHHHNMGVGGTNHLSRMLIHIYQHLSKCLQRLD